MGLMLENSSPRLMEPGMPHHNCPDKDPVARIATIEAAGRAKVPFTTGILVGIGETDHRGRRQLVRARRDLAAEWGSVQEIIIQNFRPKADTLMRHDAEPSVGYFATVVAVARWIFGAEMNLQVPPNLTEDFGIYLDAGINDWGGVSPLTIDWVNPEAPWPHLDRLEAVTNDAGFELRQRLPVYPEFITEEWIDPGLIDRVRSVDRQRWVRFNAGTGQRMTTITFLQLRPGDNVSARWAAARHREGSTAVEVEGLSDEERTAALDGGLLPVAVGSADVAAIAYVATPEKALALFDDGIPGWQITVIAGDDRESTLDALARSGAVYLRARRSRVAAAVEMAALPGIDTMVSVFVDTIEDAEAAVASGATDLLLRAWDTESLAELRRLLEDHDLVERTALPPSVTIDDGRRLLDGALFKGWLDQIDGAGTARPRTEWAPGKDLPSPHPPHRFSTRWSDEAWMNAPGAGIEGVGGQVRAILERSLGGARPNRDEIERLFRARGAEVDAVAHVADIIRKRTVGGDVDHRPQVLAVQAGCQRRLFYTNQLRERNQGAAHRGNPDPPQLGQTRSLRAGEPKLDAHRLRLLGVTQHAGALAVESHAQRARQLGRRNPL